VPANASSASLAAWTSPTSLLAGFLFVAACGYLAAVYLVGEARRRGNRAMQTYFARRAQAAAVVAGALSLAALFELQNSNRLLFDRLTGRALPLVVVAGVCGLVVFALLAIGRPIGIRVIAALGVAAVVWGWGVAQFPVLLPGTSVTLSTAGAPQQTVIAVIVVFIAAVILVGPAFGLLFALQGRRLLGDGGHGALAAAPAGHPVPPAAGGRRRREPAEQEQAGPGARTAALGIVTIAAVIRRMRQR
jgi:cytochrome d ubiquinol oxidase subunit II